MSARGRLGGAGNGVGTRGLCLPPARHRASVRRRVGSRSRRRSRSTLAVEEPGRASGRAARRARRRARPGSDDARLGARARARGGAAHGRLRAGRRSRQALLARASGDRGGTRRAAAGARGACPRPRWRSSIYPRGCGRWPWRSRACGHARGSFAPIFQATGRWRRWQWPSFASGASRRGSPRDRSAGLPRAARWPAWRSAAPSPSACAGSLAGWLDATGAPAAERGQALLMVLGAAFAILFAASLLVALGGALTGTARAQRAADLVALSGARSLRDDFPRLFTPPRLPGGAPNPRHLDRREYLARASEAARQAAARNGVDPDRLRLSFPDADSFAPLRVRAEVTASLDRGALPGQRGQSAGSASAARGAIRIEASAEAVAASAVFIGVDGRRARHAPPAAATRDRSPTGRARAMRPDVAVAFDRLAAAARRARDLAGDHLGVSLRRRAGAPVRRASRPPLGRAAGPVASPVRDRARPRAVVRLPVAGRERARFGFLKRYSLGAVAFRLHPWPGALFRRGRLLRLRPAHRRRRRRGRRRPSGLRARRASGRRSCAPRRAGTSPPGCWPRS